MKTLKRISAVAFAAVLAVSCSEDVVDDNNNNNNNGNNNPTTGVSNNTVVIDGNTFNLDYYFLKEVVTGTGDDHYEIVGRAEPTSNKPSIAFRIGVMPSSNDTWHFQDDSNNPAELQDDEFWSQVSDDTDTWYPVFTSTAFETTGDLVVEVNGDVMTISYENIELSDHYITTNVTESVLVSGKISIDMSDFQGQDLTVGVSGDLVD